MDDFADVYPVSNTKKRPGIGRSIDGTLSYNCFAVSLSRDDSGAYEPYTLARLIQQLRDYPEQQGLCALCLFRDPLIKALATRKLQFDEYDKGLAALRTGEIDPFVWAYCPLMHAVLARLHVQASAGPQPGSRDMPPIVLRTHHHATTNHEEWAWVKAQYRKTLDNTRFLKNAGYVVHRLANEEVLELDDEDAPDTAGFLRLLKREGLDPAGLCYPEAASGPRQG